MTAQFPDRLPQRLRIVCIGDELLNGLRRDTNSAELLALLSGLGLAVEEIRIVPDLPERVTALALEPGWFTIGTGGLGPTVDDRSREALAVAFGARLEHDAEHRARFQARLAAAGRDPRTAAPGQSQHPVPGATFPNPVGSADGLLFHAPVSAPDRVWLALPGVPSEMRALMHEQVLPWLRTMVSGGQRGQALYTRVWKLPEQEVSRRLEPLEDFAEFGDPGFYPGPEGVLVRLQAPADASAELLERGRRLLRERLAGHVLHEGPENLPTLLLAELSRRGQTVAVAESCTGGLLAAALTSLPGSSRIFPGAVVAYSNPQKQRWLGVSDAILEHDGAVSAACVEAMATGVIRETGAHWGLSVSGIAGPEGGSADKPVGTVWLGLAGPDVGVRSMGLRLGGNREQVRARAVGQALAWLFRCLTQGVEGA
ncbi:MAG: nicotinamide-nucleotide amidohydrolase family protein [Candidatus Cloacimonetes bacterium]|nr:nicotinamide-nucleotide amidohydrolase family protein [Candidatus Cloacimonadota bacterium]